MKPAPDLPSTGTAPGRLDFLGGVADYSGSLVLEKPIQATTSVTLSAQTDPVLSYATEGKADSVELPLDALENLRQTLPDGAAVRRALDAQKIPGWVRYPLGCLLVLDAHQSLGEVPPLRFSIQSTVPRSMGVSSSAALEVATLRALCQTFGIEMEPVQLAHLAQRAENEIVGAPCGLMDQLTVSCAKPGEILPILCRPDQIQSAFQLPEPLILAGWPSGVSHTVSGNPYLDARTATFAAFALFQAAVGEALECPAAIPPQRLDAALERAMPETVTGAQLLEQGLALADSMSRLYSERNYNLRDALAFPVHENLRAERALTLLSDPKASEDAFQEAGELLYAAHADYSRIGLGHPRTDAMVEAVRQRGPDAGFYGARVSGGGSGGTVVVLLRAEALEALGILAEALRPAGAPSVQIIL
ncbi:MAG: hypothetical protein ACFBZ8_06180 [Opitutales bacterium]